MRRRENQLTRDYSLDGRSPATGQRRPPHVRDDDWIRALLRRGQAAHIGTRWDDQPFVTPTNYWFDEAGHRLIFHSNIVGRLRANIERHARASAEVSEIGRPLPSNIALEFSLQYRSVMIFGEASIITEFDEQQRVLHALISKYFPSMTPGREYRPVTAQELKRTTVYALKIQSWSGKENWKEQADQSDEWPPLEVERLAPRG
jgi:nitroimidazol reductase NimA-like FMN-containing flavoprotein (pyridoxamine 5'-phosphate oxidase superfamily)